MAQRMNAGEAVVELLRQEGVSKIFGIVGSSFLDISDPLYDRTDPDEMPRPARLAEVQSPQGG